MIAVASRSFLSSAAAASSSSRLLLCVLCRIVRAFLIEEQKIVKSVLRARKVTTKAQ